MKTTRKMRVLLADGHREVRKVLHEYVDKLDGFQVVGEVADGLQAIEEAERLKPDVVILDFELQRRTGLEATKLIKQRSASTKVVVTTLFDDPLYRARAQQAAADGVVVKSSLKKSLKSVFSTLAHDRGSTGT